MSPSRRFIASSDRARSISAIHRGQSLICSARNKRRMVRFAALGLLVCALHTTYAGLSERSIETPARHVDFLHMRLELRMTAEDIENQEISGVVTFRVRPRGEPGSGGVDVLRLNAVGLDIQKVEELPSGQPLSFSADDPHLKIQLERRYGPGETFAVRISYAAKVQAPGLYSVRPDDDHPARPRMVYSMSEPLVARYWVPCHDWPDTRWPSDIFISVPAPLSGVSIGVPVGEPTRDQDGLRRFHWRQEVPVGPNLLGFVVGEFVTLHDTWRDRPVLAYVQPGREEEARYTLRRVPEILEHYSNLLGVEYPFGQYAHVSVVGHFHGGMEHGGFSMITPSLFTTGDRGHVPESRSQYNYVAHMLAHQWFAGIVNYCDVREAWLNEAFGTYLHLTWMAQADSEDAFVDTMWELARGVAGADRAGTGRPMVRKDLKRAADIYRFDGAKIYWKGAWLVHMLRHQLGDDVFKEATRTYLNRFRSVGSASTDDLCRTFTDVAGRDLKPFFDQWVRRGGVPQLEVTCAWDTERHRAVFTIEQRQQIDQQNPPFAFPIDLWVLVNGTWDKRTVDVTAAEAQFGFECASAPELCCVDPGGGLLARQTENKPEDMWLMQVRSGPTALARSRAVQHLRAGRDERVTSVLCDALLDGNEFWGVRRRAAEALGARASPPAGQALLEAMQRGVQQPEARAAVINALARFPGSADAHRVVLHHARSDPHILAQATGTRALAKFNADLRTRADSEAVAANALPPTSRHVRHAALATLRRMKDPAGLEVLVADAKADPDDPVELRRRLLEVVAELAEADPAHRPKVVAYLLAQLVDGRPAVRTAAFRGLGAIGDDEVIKRLREFADKSNAAIRAAAEEAIEAIEGRR